jgi:hypothetical protein
MDIHQDVVPDLPEGTLQGVKECSQTMLTLSGLGALWNDFGR